MGRWQSVQVLLLNNGDALTGCACELCIPEFRNSATLPPVAAIRMSASKPISNKGRRNINRMPPPIIFILTPSNADQVCVSIVLLSEYHRSWRPGSAYQRVFDWAIMPNAHVRWFHNWPEPLQPGIRPWRDDGPVSKDTPVPKAIRVSTLA